MRAFLSNPDSGVRRLRPDLYQADRLWLERVAVEEAERILGETQRQTPTLLYSWAPIGTPTFKAKVALAEALAGWIGED